MNRRLLVKIMVALVILQILAILVISADTVHIGASDSDSIFSTFPIWWVVIFVPIFVKKQREKQALQHQEKAKRKLKRADRYEMMQHLVDDIDDDEMDYLQQRLYAVHGDVSANYADRYQR